MFSVNVIETNKYAYADFKQTYQIKSNSMQSDLFTAWKVSKYGVISGPYFTVFGLNTGKYGPEITFYLDTFQAVTIFIIISEIQPHMQIA